MSEIHKKLPISVLIASHNEGHLLEECLKSVEFCDEIVGINLESTDNTKVIMEKYCTTYLEHKRVPIIEEIHQIFIPKLKNDWFILIDPDERIRPELATDIMKYIQNPEPFKSLIRVYLMYYFRGKMLKGGPYNKPIRGRLLFYKPGIDVSNKVHTGITAKAGYGISEIPFTGKNYDEHLWCNSWKQLRDKHTRYADGEGKVLYAQGKRYNIISQLTNCVSRFLNAYFQQAYYKDGWTGIRFACNEARYVWLSWKSLNQYQKLLSRTGKLQTPQQVILASLQDRVDTFIKTTEEIKNTYHQTAEKSIQESILSQYQKSLHRLVNDLLEQNAFDLAKIAMETASFNNNMQTYIANHLLLGRLKLIQMSGSYKLVRFVSNFLRKQ